MATATEDQITAFGEREMGDLSPIESTQPLDLGLLVTLNSRMHCRMPMERVDQADLPVRQPVYVDGTGVVPIGTSAAPRNVATYRCACGFTMDDPGLGSTVSAQALAS